MAKFTRPVGRDFRGELSKNPKSYARAREKERESPNVGEDGPRTRGQSAGSIPTPGNRE